MAAEHVTEMFYGAPENYLSAADCAATIVAGLVGDSGPDHEALRRLLLDWASRQIPAGALDALTRANAAAQAVTRYAATVTVDGSGHARVWEAALFLMPATPMVSCRQLYNAALAHARITHAGHRIVQHPELELRETMSAGVFRTRDNRWVASRLRAGGGWALDDDLDRRHRTYHLDQQGCQLAVAARPFHASAADPAAVDLVYER